MKISNYNPNIVVVDLENRSIINIEPTAEMRDHIGGAAINALLMEKYSRQDPLVLGTGPLTGGFAPASCLMVASFCPQDPYTQSKKICHVPVTIKSGPLLKLSGMDYVVFLGQADKSLVIHIEKGQIRMDLAENLAGLDIPEAVKQLKLTGMQEAALITGPDAKASQGHHTASTGVFGGFDRCGLAGNMASKNIRALVLGGGKKMAFDSEDLTADSVLTAKIKKQLPRNRFLTILGKLPDAGGAKALAKKHFRHSHACYHCPVGCINFLRYPADTNNTGKGQETVQSIAVNGVFVMDHDGFAALCHKRPKDGHVLMGKAMALGLDPWILSEEIDSNSPLDPAMTQLESMVKTKMPDRAKKCQHLNDGISATAYHLFGGALPQILPPQSKEIFGSWEERVAFAMIVGVCPIPLLGIQALSPSAFLPFITRDHTSHEALMMRLEKGIQLLLNRRPARFVKIK